MKKLATVILVLLLTAVLCSCKARTGNKPSEPQQKGARENVVVSENPRLDEQPEPDPESESEPDDPEPDPRPAELAAEMLAAAKAGEKSGIQHYINYNRLLGLEEGQDAENHFKQLFAYMKYEILSSDVRDDSASVTVKFTNIDMAVVLPLYYGASMQLELDNALSDEPLDPEDLEPEYIKIFSDLLDEYQKSVIEKLVDINLEKSDDEWKIKLDDSLGDAMLGGYFTTRGLITGS